MATFVTADELRAAVTAANAQRAEPLPDHWDALLPRANVRAYGRLRAACLGRGMTPAEFALFGADADSDGYDWNLRLGVLFAFLEAARADEDRGKAFRDEIEALLTELADDETPLVVDGALWAPAPGQGRVGWGALDTSADRVLLDEPDGAGGFTTDGGTRL